MYTLTHTISPSESFTQKGYRSAIKVVAGTLLMILGSKLYIPIEPVPVTGQTFGLFLIALTFGWRLSLTSVLSWQFLGACGLPVFASGAASGLAVFSGPTAGYLLGFVLVAGFCGYVAETRQAWLGSLLPLAAVLLVGHAIIFTSGVWWLSQFTGNLQSALQVGLYPFIPGDLIKMALVILCLTHTWKMVRKL